MLDCFNGAGARVYLAGIPHGAQQWHGTGTKQQWCNQVQGALQARGIFTVPARFGAQGPSLHHAQPGSQTQSLDLQQSREPTNCRFSRYSPIAARPQPDGALGLKNGRSPRPAAAGVGFATVESTPCRWITFQRRPGLSFRAARAAGLRIATSDTPCRTTIRVDSTLPHTAPAPYRDEGRRDPPALGCEESLVPGVGRLA